VLRDPQSQLESRCPRRFQAVATLAVLWIVGMSAVLRLEAQEQTTESKPKESKALADRDSKPKPGSATKVRGRVLGPDGKPVSGAKLYLGSVSKWNDGQRHLRIGSLDREPTTSVVRATSDTDGHFGFTFSSAELMTMDRGNLMAIAQGDVVGEVMAVAPGHGCGWEEIDSTVREITVRLVDDVPVAGRIFDNDGQPVAGARIRTIGIGAAPREDLIAPSVMAWQKREGFVFEKVWNGSLPGQPGIITTGRDGCFRLTGIGRDRLVQICIEAPPIATAFPWVMTRTGGPLKVGNARETVFAASFDFVGQPSRSITGTVRNKSTGKPMAGVSVNLGGRSGLIKSVTDKNGHYELRGAAKARTYRLVASPGDGLSFERQLELQDTPGLGSLRCDIDLVSALTVHGRVTEKDTGKPVAGAQVDYHPVGGNSYVDKILPGLWNPRSEATAAADGSYTLTVMPGPGVIGVKGPKLTTYAPAVSTAEERKRFFKGPVQATTWDNFITQALGGGVSGAITVDSYNALVLIEPGEEERVIASDVALESPHELKGRVVGPDDQPLTGTTVYGLERLGVKTLKGSDFTVRGVNPKGKRSLVFYDKERDLGYYLRLAPKSAERLTVKLERCGSVSGRILDEDGQPVAGAAVHVMGHPNNPNRDFHRVSTDGNGHFHVTGLVAGQEYYVGQWGDVPVSRVFLNLTLEAGQHKDLGDIKIVGPAK